MTSSWRWMAGLVLTVAVACGPCAANFQPPQNIFTTTQLSASGMAQDVNGDSLPDWIITYDTGPIENIVWLNTGTGWVEQSEDHEGLATGGMHLDSGLYRVLNVTYQGHAHQFRMLPMDDPKWLESALRAVFGLDGAGGLAMKDAEGFHMGLSPHLRSGSYRLMTQQEEEECDSDGDGDGDGDGVPLLPTSPVSTWTTDDVRRWAMATAGLSPADAAVLYAHNVAGRTLHRLTTVDAVRMGLSTGGTYDLLTSVSNLGALTGSVLRGGCPAASGKSLSPPFVPDADCQLVDVTGDAVVDYVCTGPSVRCTYVNSGVGFRLVD